MGAMFRAAVLLLALLGLAACREEGKPTAAPVGKADAPSETWDEWWDKNKTSFPPLSWTKFAPEQIAEAKKHGVPVAFENDLGMRFVLIPAGTFLMGPGPSDSVVQRKRRKRKSNFWIPDTRDERPRQTSVTLRKSFYLQTTEVTNDQFRSFRPLHSSGFSSFRVLPGGQTRHHSLDGGLQPVVRISLDDALQFAAWLSQRDRERDYRLPTEVESERAARAGTQSPYFWGADPDAANEYMNGRDPAARLLFPPGWVATEFSNSDGHAVSAPVASYRPNPYGLYDMLGNVHEWCEWDVRSRGRLPRRTGVFDGVARGGSWSGGPQGSTVSGSATVESHWKMTDCGFRLVSPLPESSK